MSLWELVWKLIWGEISDEIEINKIAGGRDGIVNEFMKFEGIDEVSWILIIIKR